MTKAPLPFLLSFTGGFVDTAGFLALQGLFTAHVTGNFVTLGAALALGTSGVLAKLLALPVFSLVIVVARLSSRAMTKRGQDALHILLILQLLLFCIGAALVLILGPFQSADQWPALASGMVLVAAMAVQNAAHRSHLTSAPPSTLMTGTTTQIMIDLADLMAGQSEESPAVIRSRLRRMSLAVALFALGCAAAALLFVIAKNSCFAIMPLLGLAALFVYRPEPRPA